MIQLHTPIYLKQHTGPLDVSRESGASSGQVEETHGRVSLVFDGFCDGDYVIFHMCGIMLVLKAVFKMLVRNASPRGHMCFRSLMCSLSGPCKLLFLFYFIASWT